MKRFTDLNKSSFDLETSLKDGIWVKCPYCQGQGVVFSKDEKNNLVQFHCSNCHAQQIKELVSYVCTVKNFCNKCERHYRVEVSNPKQQQQTVLKVACPFCGALKNGKVNKRRFDCYYQHKGKGCEPFFGFEFWFKTSFKGKVVWALNRKHLNYLIDFLGADLIEKSSAYPMSTASDRLPKFVKLAKNRNAILKQLRKLQEQ